MARYPALLKVQTEPRVLILSRKGLGNNNLAGYGHLGIIVWFGICYLFHLR